ncbi:MAG: ATP-binding protein [Candidatus Desantisbacteria bacterium]
MDIKKMLTAGESVGLLERYESGIQKIIDVCEKAGLPAPVFEERFGGFLVWTIQSILKLTVK